MENPEFNTIHNILTIVATVGDVASIHRSFLALQPRDYRELNLHQIGVDIRGRKFVERLDKEVARMVNS